MNTLILCHANRWRSTLVHAYLEQLAWAETLPHHPPQNQAMVLNFRSAGFKEAGRPAGKPIRDVAIELGCNLENHRSRVVTVEDILWADLIIHMGAGNLARLKRLVFMQWGNDIAFHMSKAHCLGEWCTPTRGSIQDFAFLKRDTEEFDEVVRYVVKACEKLMQEVIVPRAMEEQRKELWK
jgi:protein-tyrosine-phosphatase